MGMGLEEEPYKDVRGKAPQVQHITSQD
jgi:hypothetical protein